jgi:putative phosphoesterase
VKIGVLSDTHRKIELAQFCIDTLVDEGAEYLIHAGDIVEEKTLKLLENAGLPYKAVLGNNDLHLHDKIDRYALAQEPHFFTWEGLHVKLMHHPFYLTPEADLVVYGHTHYFDASLKGGTFYLNPGEVCARKKNLCECALLHVNAPRWDVTRFTCRPEKRNWKKEYWTFS